MKDAQLYARIRRQKRQLARLRESIRDFEEQNYLLQADRDRYKAKNVYYLQMLSEKDSMIDRLISHNGSLVNIVDQLTQKGISLGDTSH